jgi:malate synthase
LSLQVFDDNMPTPNQLHVAREDVNVTARDLLQIGDQSQITEAGLKSNIDVGLRYA